MFFKNYIHKILISASAIACMFGCKEAYNPPQIKNTPNYLVVDGVLASGDSTKIKLSRTRSFNDSVSYSPETSAKVEVIGEGSDNYSLTETSSGTYFINYLSLNPGENYKLRISTTDGKVYESDPVTVKQTPPIDSVSWTGNNDGIQIFVNTHDQSNNTRYYRWEYEEIWEYHAAFDSYYTYSNNQLIARDAGSHVYVCWHDRPSTELVLANSAALSQDIIYQNPLAFIQRGSEKISVQYSILVKQFALTKEAYEYWESLRKSSQITGGIFDPLPSQLIGNMHCISNSDEKALGYVAASSVQEERIFIKNSEVGSWPPEKVDCPEKIIPGDSVDYYFGSHIYYPVAEHGLTDFSGSYASCTDCTLLGGTLIKPTFWP